MLRCAPEGTLNDLLAQRLQPHKSSSLVDWQEQLTPAVHNTIVGHKVAFNPSCADPPDVSSLCHL